VFLLTSLVFLQQQHSILDIQFFFKLHKIWSVDSQENN